MSDSDKGVSYSRPVFRTPSGEGAYYYKTSAESLWKLGYWDPCSGVMYPSFLRPEQLHLVAPAFLEDPAKRDYRHAYPPRLLVLGRCTGHYSTKWQTWECSYSGGCGLPGCPGPEVKSSLQDMRDD